MLSLCGFFRFLEEHCNSRDVSKNPKSIVIPKSTHSCLPMYFIYKWESMIEIKLIAMNYSYLTCTVPLALYLFTHYIFPVLKKIILFFCEVVTFQGAEVWGQVL